MTNCQSFHPSKPKSKFHFSNGEPSERDRQTKKDFNKKIELCHNYVETKKGDPMRQFTLKSICNWTVMLWQTSIIFFNHCETISPLNMISSKYQTFVNKEMIFAILIQIHFHLKCFFLYFYLKDIFHISLFFSSFPTKSFIHI
jgi:hypothetical protein